jgi:spermidine synthase
MDIAGRLERAHIGTSYVNRHYLDAMLTPDRLADLRRAVAGDAAINRDFSPVLYFHCLRLWASQFNPRFGWVEGALAAALGIYVLRLRGVAVTLFASGFAASSLEVVLLLGFQALCGSLYYQLGVIITVFMAGLAAGAAWAGRLETESILLLAALALAVAALGFLLPFFLTLLSRAAALRGSAFVVRAAIALLTFALAAPVGAQFPLANRISFHSCRRAERRDAHHAPVPLSAGNLYTADFMGAFVGALLAGALLIPLMGVSGVCLLAGALNALAAGALFWRKSVT